MRSSQDGRHFDARDPTRQHTSLDCLMAREHIENRTAIVAFVPERYARFGNLPSD